MIACGLERHDERPVALGQVCAEDTDKESDDVSRSLPDRGRSVIVHMRPSAALAFPPSVAILQRHALQR